MGTPRQRLLYKVIHAAFHCVRGNWKQPNRLALGKRFDEEVLECYFCSFPWRLSSSEILSESLICKWIDQKGKEILFCTLPAPPLPGLEAPVDPQFPLWHLLRHLHGKHRTPWHSSKPLTLSSSAFYLITTFPSNCWNSGWFFRWFVYFLYLPNFSSRLYFFYCH